MGRVGLILKRELQAYAFSPATWGIIAIAWASVGAIFRYQVLPYSQLDINRMWGQICWWVTNLQIVLLPLITMRLLAEEKRSGTFEMLVTAPVREWEIVVAKFFAAFTINAVMWSILPIYALILANSGGDPDWGPILCGYGGVVLCGMLLTAVGLVASAMTASPIMAAFLGFMLCVALLWVPSLQAALPESWTRLRDVLQTGNLIQHTQEAARGLVDLVNLSYQLAGTGLALLFATRILEIRKWK